MSNRWNPGPRDLGPEERRQDRGGGGARGSARAAPRSTIITRHNGCPLVLECGPQRCYAVKGQILARWRGYMIMMTIQTDLNEATGIVCQLQFERDDRAGTARGRWTPSMDRPSAGEWTLRGSPSGGRRGVSGLDMACATPSPSIIYVPNAVAKGAITTWCNLKTLKM